VAALYGYRHFDAPRTDQCPPPFAPERECLVYEEQFRTLAYAALRGDAGAVLRDVDVVVSYQRQHERRRRDRPDSRAVNGFLDDVDTLGLAVRAATPRLVLAGSPGRPGARDAMGVRLRYGAEGYRDQVASAAWITFTDVDITRPYSRGQYVDGSVFLQAGAFVEAELDAFGWLRARAGGRAAVAGARAGGDPESGTRAVQNDFGALLGRAGLELRPVEGWSLLANVDQGFRAPNLDDLTSRQQAGPGFQFENADLRPERAVTYELGSRVRVPGVDVEAWAYATEIDGAITRVLRAASDCPPATPQCVASWSRFQLINARDASWVLGAEAAGRVELPAGFGLSATFAYAWGEGPNSAERPNDPARAYEPRVPLSRIPPMNGTVDARWRHPLGLYGGVAMRWATDQTRLAPADTGDARIPPGGTPGYVVVDLRAGWRVRDHLRLGVVFENVFDTPYRVHGSSVNGPGRGVTVSLTAGL
jgi:iron complex outermembrane receptor protein/hemoglobin/transferrin/lactoferrin receptor protein